MYLLKRLACRIRVFEIIFVTYTTKNKKFHYNNINEILTTV
jgi:hypothetical protein